MNWDELLALGFVFHGHKCPAMPLGLRAGLAALEALGVARARDKELYCLVESGPAHATMCFVDGVQVATGCTFGKANIERLSYGKNAFTLIDVAAGRGVRVAVRPAFLKKGLSSRFVELRRRGVPPQDVPPEVVEPLIERIAALPAEEMLLVGPAVPLEAPPREGTFEWRECEKCGEVTFACGLRYREGKLLCAGCAGYGRAGGR